MINPYKDAVPNISFNKSIIPKPPMNITLNLNIKIKNKFKPDMIFNHKPSIIQIPLNIYQTWHTLDLPPYMKLTVEKLKMDNPEFKHYLYDDTMCREFIKNNFDSNVLEAFDTLKPGAFKADLWRCCILYINGGIYLDIKFVCKQGFKLSMLTHKEYFVRDYPNERKFGIYQALMVNLPKNQILWKSIYLIVNNVKNNFYGISPLDITGPHMMNKFFTNETIKNFDIHLDRAGIYFDNRLIITIYDQYRKEQNTYQNTLYYYDMWKNKDIYSRERDLNSRPADLQSDVLPTELSRDMDIAEPIMMNQ